MGKNIKILFTLGLFLSFLFFPIFPALADCEPGAILPPCTCSGNCQLTDFLALGSNLVWYGLGILSALALALVIYGGFNFLLAMGNPEKIQLGKKILGGTFRGVLIVLCAWLIVNTIIYFLTGDTSGLLFGQAGNAWWQFKATTTITIDENEFDIPIPEGDPCPHRKTWDSTGKVTNNIQVCKDTDKGANEKSITPEKYIGDYNCRSLGICEGPKNILCCDTGEIAK